MSSPMDTKKARSSAPEILPSLSRSKCWKIRCSSPCLLLELEAELDPDLDPLPSDEDDDDDGRLTAAPLGLATSDCPHMNGSLKLRLLDGRFAISVPSLAAQLLQEPGGSYCRVRLACVTSLVRCSLRALCRLLYMNQVPRSPFIAAQLSFCLLCCDPKEKPPPMPYASLCGV
uniref:Uncharacterized protein n=1 Tax=Zea mays TaxID=4577 RepID=A0A804M4P7_MAIZE